MDKKYQGHLEIFLQQSKEKFDKDVCNIIKPLPINKLSKYIFQEQIGKGSFGSVYKSINRNSPHEIYAIKVLKKKHVIRMKQQKHTISEIVLLSILNFDFIIKLLCFFMDNAYLYMVTPYIYGGELFSHLRKLRKFDELMCKFYAAQIVIAYDYLHYLGVVYRDLKPENILLASDGYIKLADFGFAKKLNSDGRTYTLCGTPEYLSPEVILNIGYGYSVDWWALGVLIYELASGFTPFSARTPLRIYEKIVDGLYFIPPYFSKELEDLVVHLLEVDKTKRFGVMKKGSRDVKDHAWFRELNFDHIFDKRAQPPYIPRLTENADYKNMDSKISKKTWFTHHSSLNIFEKEFEVFKI